MHQDGSIWILNINDLGETHGGFFKEILESVTGKSRKRIGEVFVEYNERFLRYSEYCAQLPKAMQLLDTLVSVDETIAEEVSKCEKAAGKFKLVDLLLQRLVGQTQYHSIKQAYCIINVSEVSL